jgi:hypothetical protein
MDNLIKKIESEFIFQYWENRGEMQFSGVRKFNSIEGMNFMQEHEEYAQENSIAELFIGTREEAREKFGDESPV